MLDIEVRITVQGNEPAKLYLDIVEAHEFSSDPSADLDKLIADATAKVKAALDA
jgi:hypothetical protein